MTGGLKLKKIIKLPKQILLMIELNYNIIYFISMFLI